MKLTIQRISDNGTQTLGHLRAPNGFVFQTLELPWKNNESKVSCIPKGKYLVSKRTSDKYGLHFHIQNVPGRSFILIHHGNYYTDILGCILLGKGLKDINGDGQLDVTSSKAAMKELLGMMPDNFEIEIQ
jgi:hypothetical protein